MNLIRKCLLLVITLIIGCSGSNLESGPGVLVSTKWLQDQLNDPNLVLLHVGSSELYDSVHIPGSLLIDPYDFTQTIDGLRNEIPHMDTIVALLTSVGVNMDSRIVLYYEDEDLITRTARVFLTLDYAGMGDRTSVLNGGLPGWMEEDRATTNRAKDITAGDLKPGVAREVNIRASELNQHRWDPDFVIVDTRSREEYFGEFDTIAQKSKGGHVEGAYFMPYETVFSDSSPHMWREDTELLKEFEKVGMDPAKTSCYYCGSGIRASVSYLTARHLGFPALLYDGSYQEWEKLALPLTSPVIAPAENDKNDTYE